MGTQLPGQPNWQQLAKDLHKSTIFLKVIDEIYPVKSAAYATFLKILSDESSEDELLFLLNKMALPLTDAEILELNIIFENNNFTIRL